MRLTFETAEQVAQRTGRPMDGLLGRSSAWVSAASSSPSSSAIPGTSRCFPGSSASSNSSSVAWTGRWPNWPRSTCPCSVSSSSKTSPAHARAPGRGTITAAQEAMPYEKVSALIEKSQSFMVNECICKKEQAMLGKPCDRPIEVCLAMAPVPGVFSQVAFRPHHHQGRDLRDPPDDRRSRPCASHQQPAERSVLHLQLLHVLLRGVCGPLTSWGFCMECHKLAVLCGH